MRRMLAAMLMMMTTAACAETLEPVAAQLDCEMSARIGGRFNHMPSFIGYRSPQEAVEQLIASGGRLDYMPGFIGYWSPQEGVEQLIAADDDIRSSMPAGVGDYRIHPAAERPAEGWFAGDAEFWVVVGENGDRVLIAGVNPAPGDPDGFVVRNVELCGPNFVDNP